MKKQSTYPLWLSHPVPLHDLNFLQPSPGLLWCPPHPQLKVKGRKQIIHHLQTLMGLFSGLSI